VTGVPWRRRYDIPSMNLGKWNPWKIVFASLVFDRDRSTCWTKMMIVQEAEDVCTSQDIMHSMIADFFMFCEVFFDGYSELCNPEYTRHLCEYGMVFLDGVVLMEFFLLMIRMEFFYSIYMGSFLI
jgi:hypothetical protein